MSNRVEIHSIWQICIRAILLFLILLTYLGGNTAKCDTTVAPLPFSDDCNATAASRVVEILSVSGCERPPQPGRRREAYRCFADGTSARAVTLTVRGRGFPVNASLMRVLLKEHAHIPVHCGRGNDCGLVTMECINVQPSSVFPQQIFSCMLPHPTKSHHQKPQWLYRLERHPMWMDLELQRAPTKTERNEKGENIQEFVTIGILRHAVELCLAQDTTVPDTSDEDFIKEISENPLELLFQNAQGESDSTDPWLSLGIGGLKDQLQTLYRRVFLSRLPSLRGVTGSLKLPHVRGVILHGPPGNGKTLIARTLAILLDGDAKVTIINAADILSKYVGDSEKNLQELFIDPDEEENDDEDEDEDAFSKGMRDGRRKDMGRKRLHTIIIDEIEALFRRRGVSGDESAAKAVYDGLTNQLLTLMDGLIATDNILVFGLTNQLHLIDHALLRPGRFEVVIEVPHPNFEGRKEMFLIHTRELRERNYLAADVDVELLAAQTGGFSGADISGTVRAATSHALVRYHDALVKNATTKSSSSVSNNDANVNTEIMKERFHVSNEDFTLALEEMSQTKGQITPGETVGGIDFNRNRNAGGGANFSLVDYDGSFTRNKEEARRLLQSVHRSRLVCAVVVIIYGPPGSGKTTLAGELLKLGSFDVTTHLTSSVLNQSPQDNSLEVLNKLRSAVYFKGNTSILIENVENYLQNSGPMSMEILKTAFHEFKTTTSTSSTSTCGKRWLIVTTSEKEVFQDLLRSVEYDLQLSLHLIQRKDLLPLLHHYGILSSNISTADDVIRAYPTSLSYRQFLRITDLALGRAHDSFVNDAAMEKHEDGRFFSRSNDIFLQAGRNSKGDTKGVPLSNKKEINKFSAAVRDVVSAMGLTDAFDRVFTVHDTLEGDEVLWPMFRAVCGLLCAARSVPTAAAAAAAAGAGVSSSSSACFPPDTKADKVKKIRNKAKTRKSHFALTCGIKATNQEPRPLYLDFQATAPLDPRVLDKMLPYLTERYGNPHSRTHSYGWKTEEAVEKAREEVASLIGTSPKGVFFTSGATESNNIAIKGVAYYNKGKKNHIITLQTEHKCVLDSCRYLEMDGFEVTYLPVEKSGLVNLKTLEEAIRPTTALVSCMYVHNEIGVIQPIREIGRICHAKKVLFHTDAAQALGKVPIDVERDNIDLMSLSSHKIYGPKGCGALFMRRRPRVRVRSPVSGGGQERGVRSGTVATAQVVGMGAACAIAKEEMERDNAHISRLAKRLLNGLRSRLPHIAVNGDERSRYYGNLNISFACVEGESLLMGMKNVAVSSGSACTSASLEPSYVLRALGIDAENAHTSIRFGIGRFTTEREIDVTIEECVRNVERLREMSPLWDLMQEGKTLADVEWR